MKYKCDNCGKELDEKEFIPLEECDGLTQRLTPGGVVPDGECPDCRAFVYGLHITPPLPQVVVGVSSDGYWAKAEDLEGVLDKLHDGGSRGSPQVVVYIYTGSKGELDGIYVDNGGTICYPPTCTSNRVGKVKMPIRKEK